LLVLFALLVLVALGLFGYGWSQRARAERKLMELIEQLDRDDRGWRLADIEAAHSAIPDAENGALVAAAVLRKNEDAEVMAFSDDVVPCELNPRDSVMTNAQKLASLPSGGTNCSAPLRRLNKLNAKADLVFFVSDNMSWVDGHGGGRSTATMSEWARFRSRNPKARLVCLDIQPYGSTQAAERADILNVGGFSDAVFEIVASFAANELNPDHWVGLIEQIEL
jgi:60 kDa SS-A/Ro ribonucleoprotein